MSTSSSAKSCPQCGATLPSEATDGLCPACLMAEAMVPTQTGADAAGAQPLHTPEELAPHFPQLEILECLGRGGMGVVYKARQKALNRFVALKLLAPERVHDVGFAERFQKEAQALAALNHPHIVTVYDFGSVAGVGDPGRPASARPATDKMYFFLMEFVDGVNLRQAMKAGRFTPEQALAIVPPVCEALQYAHEHGIVHRDIKPENLLLDKEGRVKIADFGIAKMVGAAPGLAARLGATTDEPQPEGPASLSVGTPHYMAPEQKQHRRTDHRADIYSLGVVLYELLTGELPADKLQPPSHKVQIDVRLDEVVLRALEREPERRYQQASVLKTQVETILTTPPPSGAKDPAELTSHRPPAAQAAGGVLPSAASPLYHRPGNFRERWSWDATFVWCVTALLTPLPGILAACLVSTLGAKALFFLLLELIPLLNAVVCFAVLRRMDRLRDHLPPDALELAEALYAAHTAQSPCLAILCADHLELRRVAGEPVTIPLSDIETVTEVRWLSGRRLWWKRGLKIQRRSAPPVVLALAEPVFQRWQPFLAGAVQKLAAQPSRAAVTPSPVESPTRILTRNLILVFGMAFGIVAIPLALASPYPWKQFGLICAPIMIVVGFLRLSGKWPFPSLLFKPEVRQAFKAGGMAQTGDAAIPPQPTAHIPAAEAPPRFSRTAIVGVCWTLLALLLVALTLMVVGYPAREIQASIAPWLGWLKVSLILMAYTVPFGTTILGWIAVSQIRRSAGKLYGLGLAVFDGLLFPLLLLDGICVGVLVGLTRIFVTFHANFSNLNTAQVHLPVVTRLANLLSERPELTVLVVGALLILVDFLIIRAVWRAVNKPSGGVRPPLLSPAAAGAKCKGLAPAVWIAASVAGALLLLVGLPVRALFESIRRPAQAQPQGEVRYRIFEAEARSVETLVPGTTRKPGQMLDSELEIPNRPPQVGSPVNMVSQTAEIGGEVLGKLLLDSAKAPWLLADKREKYAPWPGRAFSWGCSRLGEFFGTSNASGLLGVRRHNGVLQLRVEMHPAHSLNCGYQNALIVWEGAVPPPGRARTFFMPFSRKDGAARFLVIAFEVNSGGHAERSAQPRDSQLSFDDLTVLLHDDNVDVHYALFYQGNRLYSGGGLDSSATHPRVWQEQHALQLEYGRTFSYQRESVNPQMLHINGKQYDLREGRVLVIRDDGSVGQLALFPPLAVAREPAALAKFIATQAAASVPAAAAP